MECPKCGSRIKKDMPICSRCGFKVEELKNVSNFKARKILRSGSILEREKVFYTHNVPKDLVKKDLILFTILLGFIGGHNFYVGRIFLGISKLISFVVSIILSIIVYRHNLYQVYTLMGLLMAYPIIFWFYDIIRVLLNRYPIPVVLEE